jgi:hypothetical protein
VGGRSNDHLGHEVLLRELRLHEDLVGQLQLHGGGAARPVRGDEGALGQRAHYLQGSKIIFRNKQLFIQLMFSRYWYPRRFLHLRRRKFIMTS